MSRVPRRTRRPRAEVVLEVVLERLRDDPACAQRSRTATKRTHVASPVALVGLRESSRRFGSTPSRIDAVSRAFHIE